MRDGTLVRAVGSTPTGYVAAHDTPLVELPAATWILGELAAIGDELRAVIYAHDPSHRAPAIYVASVTAA